MTPVSGLPTSFGSYGSARVRLFPATETKRIPSARLCGTNCAMLSMIRAACSGPSYGEGALDGGGMGSRVPAGASWNYNPRRMYPFRIALANLRFPETREESVVLAERAIADASTAGAGLVGFPECFVPG